jgi:predicted permease
MPRDFIFVDPEIQAWVPLTLTASDKQRRHYGPGFSNIGRLKPGATIEQAQSQLRAIDRANLDRYPESRETLIAAGFHSAVEPFKDSLVRDVRSTLFLLWGGAGFVLLIGTVNVGNLALARSRSRSRELAMRMTVGASRGQLIRQLLAENLLVSLVSGLLGLLLSAWLVAAFNYVGVDRLPRATEIRFDSLVVAFVLSTGMFVGLLLGLLPAAYSLRIDPMETLRDDTRTGAGSRGLRLTRRALVVGQFALAFVLLMGAGLLLTSFRRLLAVNPGFVPQGVVTFATDLPSTRYSRNDAKRSFATRAEAALRSIPNVASVGATNTLPFDGFSVGMVPVAEGQVTAADLVISTNWRTVTPGFFDAMRIPFVRGRNFDDRDDLRATRVTIIDEQMAGRLWPDADPLGRRIYVPTDVSDSPQRNDPNHWLTVIGVVRSARFEDLAGDSTFGGACYTPFTQEPIRDPAVMAAWAKFVIRIADGDTAAFMRAARAEVAKIDPELALYDVRTMSEQYDLSLAPRRIGMRLALGLAFVALFLAVVGIYGVLSYIVAERTRELGIRAALGATLSNIFRLVLKEAIVLVGAGVIVGLIGAVALRGGIARYLYGVGPVDPMVMAGVVAALATVALAACSIPARRATRVDPVEVLRQA